MLILIKKHKFSVMGCGNTPVCFVLLHKKNILLLIINRLKKSNLFTILLHVAQNPPLINMKVWTSVDN